MKTIYTLLIATLMLAFTACGPSNTRYVVASTPTYAAEQQPVTYTPDAVLGYDGNRCVMYVTDDRGQQFELDCNQYNSLMRSGGYNAVVGFYYNNPNSIYIHPYSSRFYRSNAADAIAAHNAFYSGYRTVYTSHRVYRPSSSVVMHQVNVQRQINGSAYKPTNALPVRASQPIPTRTSVATTPVVSQRSFATRTPGTVATPVRSGGFGTPVRATTSLPVRSTPPSFSKPSSSFSSSPSRSSFGSSSSRSSFGSSSSSSSRSSSSSSRSSSRH